jgi:GxxExxY protein
MDINKITDNVIGASIDVHRILGPGLLESTYEECLCYELEQRNIHFIRQYNLPIKYKGVRIDCGYRIDLLIEGQVVVELKAVEKLLPLHDAQLLSYLKSGDWKIGLLINFNVPVLKQGIRRRIID